MLFRKDCQQEVPGNQKIENRMFSARWLMLVLTILGALIVPFLYASSVQALTCDWTEEGREWVDTSYEEWVDQGSYWEWVDQGSGWEWVGYWNWKWVGYWKAVYVGYWKPVSSGYYKTTSVPKSQTCPSNTSPCSGAYACQQFKTSYSCGSSGCVASYDWPADDSCTALLGNNQTCSGGSAVTTYASCTDPSVSGGSIAHNSNKTFYESESVPLGSTCKSETRTCNNGNLPGSYTKSSCTVQAGCTSTSQCKDYAPNYEVCWNSQCVQSSRAQRQGNGCDRTFQCESSYWDGNTRYYDPYCTENGGTCQFKTQSCPFGQNASGTGCAEAPLGVCSSGYVDKRQQPDCFGSRVFNDPNQNPYCYQCQPASIQASFGPPWNNDSYTQGQSVPFSLGLNVAACSNAVSSGTVTFTLAGQSSTVTKSMTLGSQTLFSSSLSAPTTPDTYTASCSYSITVTLSDPNDPSYSRQTTQSGSCAPRTITVVPPAIPGACDRGPGGAQEQTYAWNESLGSLCSSPGGSSGLSDPGASGGKISWTCLGKDRGSDASCSATRTARPCESVPNACGKTAAGVYRADGSCSASVPSNSLCGCDNNWSIRVDEKTGSCIDKSWGTDVSSIYIAGSENYYACTQGYKQVWQCKTCESASNACGVKATGTYQEDGSCSAVPPTISYAVGASCPSAVNNCGATNTGTIQCDGSCLATAPANVDLSGTCSSSQNSCADTISGTWQCSASKTNKTCSVTTAPERAGYGDDCSACNNVNECNPGKKIVCTAGGGVACNVGAPLDKFTLLYSAGSGGSIVGSMSQTITRGQSGTLVTASPATGYDFIKWSDSKTSSSRGETNVQGNVSVVATFSIKSYALSVSKTGTGSGTVTSNPSGINCGLTCSANFNHGTTVALTASPTSGSSLGSWLGCDTVVGNTCNVLINGIKSVSVSFQAPPSIQSASQGPAPNYCGASPSTTFSWRYNSPAGLNQSRFDFRIIDQSTGVTVVNRSFSGLNNPNNTQNSQAVIVSLNPLEADRVAYNKSYRWEAQVWDSAGESSSMAGGTFTTTARAYPKPSFSYSPQTPGIGETVTFTETSKCYNNLNVSGDCKNMSVSYLWNFTDGNTSSTKGNTIHSFVSGGSYPVSLRITDDSRVCEYAIPVRIQLPFPAWEEVSPF